MINLIGILFLIVTEAIIVMSIISYFINKLNSKDEELAERDKELGLRTLMYRNKNLEVKKLQEKIKEYEDEIRNLKRKNNSRLR